MSQRQKTGLLCWCLLLLWCAVPASALAAEPPPLVAAQNFLHQVDAGDYAGAWALLDGHAQQLADSHHWQQSLMAVRAAYGPLLQRESDTLTARKSYYHHPDGAYVVARFRSRYTAKAAAIETVILRLEPNGRVSVISYIIN